MFNTPYLNNVLIAIASARLELNHHNEQCKTNPASLAEIIKKNKQEAREYYGLDKYRTKEV